MRRAGGWSSLLLWLVAAPLLGGLAYTTGVAAEIAIGPQRGSVSLSEVMAFMVVVGAMPGWLALLLVSPITARLPASNLGGDDLHP